MIGTLLMLLAQVSAPGPENWAYLNCILSSSNSVLETHPSRADFERRLRAACPREKAALRTVVVNKQVAAGRSAAQAEGDADEFFQAIWLQMLDLQPVEERRSNSAPR